MTRDEINNKIFELQNGDEVITFVKKRIQELEDASKESTVGQGYTTTFREYISEKTHYKPAAAFNDRECPDLVYDDITPYVNLVNTIKKDGWYNVLTLFSTIFFEVYNYLPNDDFGFGRAITYLGSNSERISIKKVKENECAFCSEKAGMAHNMFKFLGIDSEVVIGYRDSERHAYNIIYPNGYDNEPMVLFDSSFFVNFEKEDRKVSLGYYKSLKRDDYDKMMAGLPIKMDLTKTESNYRRLFNFGDDYTFEGDTPIYIAGLDRKKELPGENITDELFYSTHYENGVETVPYKKGY